jgi:regulator of replication initiation timing
MADLEAALAQLESAMRAVKAAHEKLVQENASLRIELNKERVLRQHAEQRARKES